MSENDFLKNYDENDYDRPSLTVDCVIFRYYLNKLQLLLVKRNNYPFKDYYGLPGGFAKRGLGLEQVAIQKTFEKTSLVIDEGQVEQLVTISTPDRDPRGWFITSAYLCFLPYSDKEIDLSSNAVWADVSYHSSTKRVSISINGQSIGVLAFDHFNIIDTAFERVRGRFDYKPTAYKLLPEYNRLAIYRQLYLYFMDDNISQTTFNRKYKQFFIETKKIAKTSTRKAKMYRLNTQLL